ncbi:hypothetical protein Dimus_008764, partial [Dionaea muscipula]
VVEVCEDKGSLWRKVICAKYGYNHRAWFPDATGIHKFSCLWGEVVGSGLSSYASSHVFSSNACRQIGVRGRYSLTAGSLGGTRPLMLSFPRLFRLAAAPECAVADCVQVGEVGQEWKVGFLGMMRSRNQEDLRRLIGALPDANELRAVRMDKVVWMLDSSGRFYVRSLV